MNVPALRFKEFNGDWITKALNEITGKIGDGLHSTPVYDENGQYYFVNGNNLTNSKIEISEVTKRLNGNEYSKHKIELTPQTILISINGTIGNLAFYNNEKVVLGKSACYLNLNQNENKYFVFNLLQTSKIKLHFDKELTGSTIKNLSLTTIKNTKAYFPTLPEQTKIANFLTAVDDKITLLTKKADLLSQYKKGVMQQIFSQELRFKDDDGQEFPEWEEKSLGDVAEINPKTDFLPEEFIYIDLESVEKGILLKETRIRSDDAPSRAQRFLKKEDILFQMVRPYQGNNLFFDITGDYVASTGYAQIRTMENPRFLYQSLHLENFTAEVMNRCTGTSYPAINSSGLALILITIPSLPEQTKIANFLTAIDEKITNNQTQLDAVKQYKQGLLQQMFV
jgi:type I restriction enzyme S subunit